MLHLLSPIQYFATLSIRGASVAFEIAIMIFGLERLYTYDLHKSFYTVINLTNNLLHTHPSLDH